MKLVASTNESDWELASNMLLEVVEQLDSKGTSLWSRDQVSVEKLRNNYKLEQLFWFEDGLRKIGLVFLMDADSFFWPEVASKSSLYFHKLAIHPSFLGMGFGKSALEQIKAHAISNDFEWIRFDCDDREPLHRFYTSGGYTLVDIKPMGEYMVARYQLLTSQSSKQPVAVGTLDTRRL